MAPRVAASFMPHGLRAGIIIGVALALVGLGVGTATGVPQTFQQVLVINPASSPVPVVGTGPGGVITVSGSVGVTAASPLPVTGTVQTRPAIPSGAFSVEASGGAPVVVISGPDPAGTNYAVTSVTFAGVSSAQTAYVQSMYGQTSDCISFIGIPNIERGPSAAVPTDDTVHLSFPQPFTFPAKSGAASCLIVFMSSQFIDATVVGYRY